MSAMAPSQFTEIEAQGRPGPRPRARARRKGGARSYSLPNQYPNLQYTATVINAFFASNDRVSIIEAGALDFTMAGH